MDVSDISVTTATNRLTNSFSQPLESKNRVSPLTEHGWKRFVTLPTTKAACKFIQVFDIAKVVIIQIKIHDIIIFKGSIKTFCDTALTLSKNVNYDIKNLNEIPEKSETKMVIPLK